MCSGVQQLVSIIKTYNLPCHLQGQTQGTTVFVMRKRIASTPLIQAITYTHHCSHLLHFKLLLISPKT